MRRPNAAKTFNARWQSARLPSRILPACARPSLKRAHSAQIADARPADRFAGLAPEPRPGLRSGHMPGAASVPSSALVADGKLRPASELRAIFESAGIDLSKPVVTSCGSGVTAAILTLALDTLGHTDHALYDGSWAEWGLPGETPVVLGAVSRAAGGPDRTLTAHITELEMDVMPSRRTPLPSGQKISLMRTSGMTPEYYAFLYEQVGRPHHWFVRRNMPDAMLKAELESGKSEIWVLHADGCPAGFFEIGMEDLPEKAEIRLLGLLPAYQGRGLSKFLISEAVFAAWAHQSAKSGNRDQYARQSACTGALPEGRVSSGRLHPVRTGRALGIELVSDGVVRNSPPVQPQSANLNGFIAGSG